MIKSFCDICGKEIKKGDLRGGLAREFKTFQMSPIFDQKGRPTLGPKERVDTEFIELCEDCLKMIWDFAESKKTEHLKSNGRE